MSERGVFTMRAAKRTIRALEEEARRYRVPPRTLAEQMLEEGVRMRRHPGIVFIERGSGRSAVLAGRPRLSIWQIAETVRSAGSVEDATFWLSLDAGSIERAMAYANEHKDEIDAAIAENEAAFERFKLLYPPASKTVKPRRRRAAPAR